MNASKTEHFERALATVTDRRCTITAFAAMLFSLAGFPWLIGPIPAAVKRTDGRACRINNDCDSGICSDWDIFHDSGRCIAEVELNSPDAQI
jgi:hypothetical protein